MVLLYVYLQRCSNMSNIEFYLTDIWSQIRKSIANSGQVGEAVMPYYESKLTNLTDTEAVVVAPTFINYSIMNQHVFQTGAFLESICPDAFHAFRDRHTSQINAGLENTVSDDGQVVRELHAGQVAAG